MSSFSSKKPIIFTALFILDFIFFEKFFLYEFPSNIMVRVAYLIIHQINKPQIDTSVEIWINFEVTKINLVLHKNSGASNIQSFCYLNPSGLTG